jgi:hypothetical protein
MKIAWFTVLTVLLLTSSAQAETFCQQVNRTGKLDNAKARVFAEHTNKLFKSKGVKMTITVKTTATRIITFCKEEPNGTTDDILKDFIQFSDVLSHYKM